MTYQKVVNVLTAVSSGSYYFEDIARIRRDLIEVADRYHISTGHDSYPFVRTSAPAVHLGLVLENGSTVWGDCVPVSFSGKSGRALPKDPEALASWLRQDLGKWFQNQEITAWLSLEKKFLNDFADVPAFVRYGVSQAIMGAVSLTTGKSPWRVIADEMGLAYPRECVALHGSCGGDWESTVDRMLARRLKFLPQGQFEFLERQIGRDGKNLIAWIKDFKSRAEKFGYTPTLTLDFHGALDELCDSDLTRVAEMIHAFADAAKPHHCHIESPLHAADFSVFKTRIATLRRILRSRGLHAPQFRIVADEWANSVDDIRMLAGENAVDGVHIKMPDTGMLSECAEAVKILKSAGKFALLGGSCTETMTGAKYTAHLALVTRPDAVLVKPGMGFDESYAYLASEMMKSIAEAT